MTIQRACCSLCEAPRSTQGQNSSPIYTQSSVCCLFTRFGGDCMKQSGRFRNFRSPGDSTPNYLRELISIKHAPAALLTLCAQRNRRVRVSRVVWCIGSHEQFHLSASEIDQFRFGSYSFYILAIWCNYNCKKVKYKV